MLINVKIAKLNSVHEFNVEALPPTSVQYAITYGLTQAVNDAHASVMRKNFDSDSAFIEAVEAKVLKRLEQIETGNVPGSRGPADPKAAVARKLAKGLEEAGLDLTSIEPDELAAMVAVINKRRAKAGQAHVQV